MEPTIFSQFLKALQVPHTQTYSDRKFETMTFQSLYGLSSLLRDYGVDNEAYKIEDLAELTTLTPPFLAQDTKGVFHVIELPIPAKDVDDYNGIVLLAYPNSKSTEPEYRNHRLQELVAAATKWVLLAALVAIGAYFFVTRAIWHNWALVLVTIFDIIGIFFSYLLMKKSLGIGSKTGDRVCGVLQQGGCDDIMSMKVSKLFGVISWAEVGLGYFSVSLVTLLVFPHLWGALALFNACCLPYTVWSITYQKFVAKKWCTLCVGVQTTLWLLFFGYLTAGCFHKVMPLHFDYLILLAVYVGAVLGLNLFSATFRKYTTPQS